MAFNEEAKAKCNSEEGWQVFVLFFHRSLLKGQILNQQPLSCTWTSECTCSKLFATSAVACSYSYSPAVTVTVTALQLQLQPCSYSYSPAVSYRPAVTVTALQLQLQPCSYSYSPAVTVTVTALQLQLLACSYRYSPAVTVTALQLQLQPCSVPAPCLRHQAVGVRHFINLPGPHPNTSTCLALTQIHPS